MNKGSLEKSFVKFANQPSGREAIAFLIYNFIFIFCIIFSLVCCNWNANNPGNQKVQWTSGVLEAWDAGHGYHAYKHLSNATEN